MARIRSIFPGLFTDEAFMQLTIERPLAIALLIGLWGEADDAGAFEWKLLTIKARILPAGSDDIGELLAILARLNFIRRFEIGGKPFGVIRNFVRFQRPKKPNDVHPFTAETRIYAGFEVDGRRPNAGTGRPSAAGSSEPDSQYQDDSSEPVPNQFVTSSELRPQREEGGDNRKIESSSSVAAPTGVDDEDFANRIEKAGGPNAPPCRRGLHAIRKLVVEGCDVELDVVAEVAECFPHLQERQRTWALPWLIEQIKYRSRSRRSPATPLGGGADVDGVDDKVFIDRGSPDWPRASARYIAEMKRKPPEYPRKGSSGVGWYFHRSWMNSPTFQPASRAVA